MPRKILHLDLDAFYCAVEEQRDPSLKGKPFAVGGRPDQRGVVASCSYPARRYGVRSAMPMGRAMRLCPRLVVVPGDHAAYGEASKKIMAILRDLTPLVEQISIDEAFLDVSDLPETGEAIARALQIRIQRELDLPCSLGIASNKLVAKIANNVGKGAVDHDGTPNAIKVIPPGQEAEFLAPLPSNALWGVGKKTEEKLRGIGLETIGDIAGWPQADLARRFGKHGNALAQHARGIDERPVETSRETKSISQETTFAHDTNEAAKLHQTLHKHAESVGRRLRKSGLSGTTVKLKIRWSDFTTLTRQVTLPQPTDQDKVIYDNVLKLLEKVWGSKRPVRLIGVGVSGFGTPRQLPLWDAEGSQSKQLQSTLDDLRDRFGDQAVQRGTDIDTD